MFTVQLDPAVTVLFATHVVPLGAIAKSPAFAPEIATEETVRSALPIFETVVASGPLVVPMAWLPKTRLAGETPATGAVPVPVKLTVCGLFVALSATESIPVSEPTAVGANATWIMQLPPATRLDPQLLVSAKPRSTMMLIEVSGPLPRFVKETS